MGKESRDRGREEKISADFRDYADGGRVRWKCLRRVFLNGFRLPSPPHDSLRDFAGMTVGGVRGMSLVNDIGCWGGVCI